MKNILLIIILVIVALTVGFLSGYVWGSRVNSSYRSNLSEIKPGESASNNELPLSESAKSGETDAKLTSRTAETGFAVEKKPLTGEDWWNAGEETSSPAGMISSPTPTDTPTPSPAQAEPTYDNLREMAFSETDPDFTFPARKERYFYNGPEDSKIVALTYDDGPHGTYTIPLLQVLKEEKVPATFFLLGRNAERYPDIVGMIHETGCETGNHSFTHPNLRKLSPEEVLTEIKKTSDEIKYATEATPKVFRPPYGSSGEDVARIAYDLQLDIFLWNLDTNDYKDSVTKEDIVKNIVTNVRGGAIILMHDKSRKVVEATREIIPILRERGYQFVTCSELARKVRLQNQEQTESEPAYSHLKGEKQNEPDPSISGK